MAYLKGIDVSKWQTPSDWTPTGLSFVIARASIGTSKDVQYDAHIRKARAAGLVTGAYHFNWDNDTHNGPGVIEQARHFVASAGNVDFLFLDVEGAMAFEKSEAIAFINEVHRLGRKIGLYMSASPYLWGIGQDYDWVAKWSSTPPSGGWEFWQYTSSGRATDGGRLDLNYFNGTREKLLALKGVNTGPITIPDTSTPEAPLKSYSAVSSAYTIPVLANARIYPNADFSGTPIIVSPARSFEFLGTVPSGPRIVRWAPRAGDTATYPIRTGWSGYVGREKCGTPVVKPDLTPYSKSQLDAAVAAALAAVQPDATPFDQADLDAAVAAALAALPADTTPFDQADLDEAVDGEQDRIRNVLGI